MYKIGIDIGGMSIKAGLVDNGEIIYRLAKESDIQGGLDKLVEDITYLVNELISKNNISIEEIETIGIGFPGVVTNEGAVTCVNLGLKNALIVPKLKENFKNTTVKVGNDANVAALAEYAYGSMKGYDTGVMITLGTGVGGGIVINGKLITGANGVGAEIGHMMIASNYYNCNCVNNGCFETFCSATAIIKYAQKLIQEGNKSIILNMADGNIENINAKMVFDAFRENDAVAVQTINRFKDYLAKAMASMINILDPVVISIGGGVSRASDIILYDIKDLVREYVLYKNEEFADIVCASLGADAGIIGAAFLQ